MKIKQAVKIHKDGTTDTHDDSREKTEDKTTWKENFNRHSGLCFGNGAGAVGERLAADPGNGGYSG